MGDGGFWKGSHDSQNHGGKSTECYRKATYPPPEVKLFPELGIQCDTVTSERYGWVSTKTGGGGEVTGMLRLNQQAFMESGRSA